MISTRSVLWHNPYDHSTELCQLRFHPPGWLIEGLVLIPADEAPARCDYRVDVDERWRARRVHLRLAGLGHERQLELTSERDRWYIDGAHDPALDGCTDVDLRVSPSTNTLPIRRLGLEVGAQATVQAAWVGFPDLQVVSSEQTYERITEQTYRYRSGSFAADINVDEAGMVVNYGEKYWRGEAAAFRS
jgi:uncharacterized protein